MLVYQRVYKQSGHVKSWQNILYNMVETRVLTFDDKTWHGVPLKYNYDQHKRQLYCFSIARFEYRHQLYQQYILHKPFLLSVNIPFLLLSHGAFISWYDPKPHPPSVVGFRSIQRSRGVLPHAHEHGRGLPRGEKRSGFCWVHPQRPSKSPLRFGIHPRNESQP